METLSQKDVEGYLQNNPHFVKSWFTQNVTRETLDEWILGDHMKQENSVTRCSLTDNLFRDIVQGKRSMKNNVNVRKKKEQLLQMSEREIFMELIRDIANELDVNVLCHKILLNVSFLTNSDRGSLFLTKGSREQQQFLVSKLFDVTVDSQLEDVLHTDDNQIRVPFGTGIAGTVAETKLPINIKNAYEDSRFNKAVDKKTGYKTNSILCMPILDYEGHVIGVAQIMNKSGGGQFNPNDVEVFRNYLTFCGIGITNAQLFEMSVQEYKRNQLLLTMARGIFEEQTQLDNLVQKIMVETQDLLQCERCSVYLIEDDTDGEKDTLHKHFNALKILNKIESHAGFEKVEDVMFSKVFELHRENQGNIINPSAAEIQQSKCSQIAREVAVAGEVLNVEDAETDARFGGITEYDGFKIRSLLSLPIRNNSGKILGVVQFMNKCNSKPFKEADLNIVETFAIFCGLGIHNCVMYENVCKLMAKQSVALEVLSYHATAPQEDVDKLKNSTIPPPADWGLETYQFNDMTLTDDETCQAVIQMFLQLDVVNKFHVPYEVLCRWTLSVKKNYRPVTYHNWRHGFNVAQTMFTMFQTGNMRQYLSSLEMFSLIVACLCHDLDHRGTNNAFQSKTDSPISVLYGTSTMEHHHFDQCIMILNSGGNNIFKNLSEADYREALRVVEHAILSTDLALYFRKKGKFQELVDNGEKKWKEPPKRDLLRGMMMTACDVAAITKPWEIQRDVAQLVAGEFFEQGDLERDKLNEEPIAMMDRKKKDDLPKMQVGFIDAICLPVYKMLAIVEVGLDPLLTGCLNNRDCWQNEADQNVQHDSKNDKPSPIQPAGRMVAAKEESSASDKPSSGKKKSRTCSIL